MRFGSVMLFGALWLLVVYVPVAHWIWGGGWLAARGVMDFAGGLVVHLTAGVSALLLAIMLGPRLGFPDDVQAAACAVDHHDGSLHAVGWLVRLQCGQRAVGGRRCGHGHDRHAYLGGDRDVGLDRHRVR